jgi:hypothetical protein
VRIAFRIMERRMKSAVEHGKVPRVPSHVPEAVLT